MSQLNLSQIEKNQLKTIHKYTYNNSMRENRIRVVLLCDSMSKSEIRDILLLDLQTIRRYINFSFPNYKTVKELIIFFVGCDLSHLDRIKLLKNKRCIIEILFVRCNKLTPYSFSHSLFDRSLSLIPIPPKQLIRAMLTLKPNIIKLIDK